MDKSSYKFLKSVSKIPNGQDLVDLITSIIKETLKWPESFENVTDLTKDFFSAFDNLIERARIQYIDLDPANNAVLTNLISGLEKYAELVRNVNTCRCSSIFILPKTCNEELLTQITLLRSQLSDALQGAKIKSEKGIKEGDNGKTREQHVSKIIDMAANSMENMEYEVAYGYFKEALDYRIDIHGLVSQEVGDLCMRIGGAYLITEEHDRAIEHFHQAADIAHELHGPNDASTGKALLCMANTFVAKGEHDLAVESFEIAIAALVSSGQEFYDGLRHHYTFAKSLIKVNRRDHAEAVAWGAHDRKYGKRSGELSHGMGQSHAELAGIYKDMGDKEKEAKHRDACIACFEKTVPVSQDMLLAYKRKGRTCIDRGDNRAAIRYLKKGLAIGFKLRLSGNHPDMWQSHHLLGIAMGVAGGDQAQALKHTLFAIEHANISDESGRCPTTDGTLLTQFAAMHSTAGKNYMALDQPTEAMECYRLAILHEGKCGCDDKACESCSLIVEAMEGQAELESLKGNHKKAVIHLKKCITYRPGDPRLLIRLGDALEGAKDFKGALHKYNEAQRSMERDGTADEHELALLLYRMADVLLLMDESADAEALIQRASTLCEQKYGPDHIYTAEARGALFTVEAREAAQKLFERM